MMSANYLPKTLWAALSVALGLAIILPLNPTYFRLTSLGILWAAYLFWALLSLFWAVQPEVSLDRWIALLLPTLAYILARRTHFWASEKFWLLFSLIICLVFLIGILQYFFPSFPAIHLFPGTAIPRATMGHRNYSSSYALITVPFIMRYYLISRGKRGLVPFLSFIFAIFFLLMARTRGAWIGLIGGFIFILIAGGFQRLLKYRRKLFYMFLSLMAGFCVLLVVNLPVGTKGRKTVDKAIVSLFETQQRMEFWSPCLGITNPFFGAGFGNFPIVTSPYFFIQKGEILSLNWEVHNDYLQAYVDLGVPGVVLFCLVVGIMLRLAWRGRKSGLILASGAAVVGLAFLQLTTFTSEKVSTLIWIAGVVAILNSQVWIRSYFSKNIYRWLVLTGNYLMVFWLIIFAVIVGYTIRGDLIFFKAKSIVQRVIKSEQILADPQGIPGWEIKNLRQQLPFLRVDACSRLHALANRVLPTMYFNVNARHLICNQFGGYAMELQDYVDAEIFARQGILLHPTDRISLKRLCRINLMNNQLDQAISLLSKGIELFGYYPHQSFFCDRLVEVYEYLEMPERAEYIRKAILLNIVSKPQNPFPENRSIGVPIDICFNWNDCNAALSYELYLWRKGENTPPEPTASGLTRSEFPPIVELKPDTTYIWRVRANGKYGEAAGNIWYFRTENIAR